MNHHHAQICTLSWPKHCLQDLTPDGRHENVSIDFTSETIHTEEIRILEPTANTLREYEMEDDTTNQIKISFSGKTLLLTLI